MSATIVSQQSKRAIKFHKYQSSEAVKQRRAENKRNTCHSTKTAQQAGPVDVNAKIAISRKMKRAKINRTNKSKDHAKERLVENQRNTRHSTKVAHQAADVDGIIEATKKKRATKKQQYQESKYLENTGQNYCAEEERKLMAIAVTTVAGRISAPIPGTPWNLRLFRIPKFEQTHSPSRNAFGS